jgi:hypothetical protein
MSFSVALLRKHEVGQRVNVEGMNSHHGVTA